MHIYGLILGICFVIGITYFQKNNKVIPKNRENLFIFFILIFGIIGARIYSVINNWNYFSQNLNEIYNLPGGGLGIYGGLIFGILYIYIFSKKKRYSFFKNNQHTYPNYSSLSEYWTLG